MREAVPKQNISTFVTGLAKRPKSCTKNPMDYALLREQASITAAINTHYARMPRRDHSARYFCYALLLQNGRIYVGKCTQLKGG